MVVRESLMTAQGVGLEIEKVDSAVGVDQPQTDQQTGHVSHDVSSVQVVDEQSLIDEKAERKRHVQEVVADADARARRRAVNAGQELSHINSTKPNLNHVQKTRFHIEPTDDAKAQLKEADELNRKRQERRDRVKEASRSRAGAVKESLGAR